MRKDTPAAWATQQYKMGYSQVYRIEKNTAVLNDRGEVVLPADTLYTILRPGEREQQPYVSGRVVGSSTIPLEEHLNSLVLLDGYFSEGYPLFLRPQPSFNQGQPQVVLHITGVRPAPAD